MSAAIHTPNSYHKAISSPEAKQWLQAMTEEFDAITRNTTFVLMALPKG
jgi:riboflavin biosynthesis pyrimidine reductase